MLGEDSGAAQKEPRSAILSPSEQPFLFRLLWPVLNGVVVRPILEFLNERLDRIERKLENIMATVAEVEASLEKYKADVSAKLQGLSAQIADLQAQLANGTAVEAADLDKLKGEVDAADAELNPPA